MVVRWFSPFCGSPESLKNRRTVGFFDDAINFPERSVLRSQSTRATNCATPRFYEFFCRQIRDCGNLCGHSPFLPFFKRCVQPKSRRVSGFFGRMPECHERTVSRSQTSRATNCATPRRCRKRAKPPSTFPLYSNRAEKSRAICAR